MQKSWTFGQRLAFGFGVIVVISTIVSLVAVFAMNLAIAAKDDVINHNAQNMIDSAELTAAIDAKIAAIRGYLLDKSPTSVDNAKEAQAAMDENFATLQKDVTDSKSLEHLTKLGTLLSQYTGAVDHAKQAREASQTPDAATKVLNDEMLPIRAQMKTELAAFYQREQQLLQTGKDDATHTANTATIAVIVGVIVGVILAILIAWLLTSTITRQISSAVNHIQSSSTELQSAANQQATSAKENSTAMSEITTTVNELLATSRQIAESAQRVSAIASETATGARSGEHTVQKTQEAVAGIKRQVDMIVTHMLDLGKKSQQIGGILEIINELSEQTNILSINATIEAAGAGEAGKRFAVVAEEIRKLADRVGSSTKEIRVLIDDIRASVNTTVMATESGSKAVDTGIHQFTDVASAFKQIVGSVVTTTEAAREIELSTKQQATAVEQVNVAVANVAQTTKETEASSNQTFQTASQLTGLSKDLLLLIQASA